MSSTNRGGQRSEADFYETPEWATKLLLREIDLPGGHWLEPGAGGGAIIRAVKSHYGARSPYITAIELMERQELGHSGADDWIIGVDFLTWPVSSVLPMRFDVAIGNPPFSVAQEFVERALTMADQVVFLLRLGFLESKKRRPFFEKYGAPDTFVFGSRPSFTNGGTDSSAYAWMRWKNPRPRKDGTGTRKQDGRLRILYRDE